MGVSPAGGGNDVGGVTGGGDPRLPPAEHNHIVHRDQDHYVPVSGGGEPPGDKGVQAVVGVGSSGVGGDAYRGSGDRTEGEGGGRTGRRQRRITRWEDTVITIIP